MDIASILAQSGALDSAAQELGISPQVAAAGASVLLPAILGGFKGHAQNNGVEGLGGLLQQLGGSDLLGSVIGAQPTPVAQGNDILGQIFGTKDVSRAVAADASARSGIDADTLKKLLPIVAMLVAGYLATHRGQGDAAAPAAPAASDPLGGGLGGMLGQVLGSVLGGGAAAPAPAAPAAPAAGSLGGLANILDLDGDGNPLNDIIGMAGRLRQ